MGALSRTVVIGGGPGGSAAATALARMGAPVTLLEREREPVAKVCGEFLSVEACEAARALGVDPLDHGAASIDTVRVAWREKIVETKLPFRAASLSRSTFDEALLRSAENAGVTVLRGTRALSIENGRVTARDESGPSVHDAGAVVLASGKTEFFGARRSGGHFPDALGFKMHLGLPPYDLERLGTAVELTLFDGGYYGMQRIENDRTAFAVVISRAAYRRFGAWERLIESLRQGRSPSARSLANATDLWQKPLAVSGVPYGFTYNGNDDATHPELYRVGDQLAVIPSFTGDGMAIALVTGTHAATAIASGTAAPLFHAHMRTRLRRPMRVAGALSRAIRTPLGRAGVVLPASLVPQLFSIVARLTRIPTEPPG